MKQEELDSLSISTGTVMLKITRPVRLDDLQLSSGVIVHVAGVSCVEDTDIVTAGIVRARPVKSLTVAVPLDWDHVTPRVSALRTMKGETALKCTEFYHE